MAFETATATDSNDLFAKFRTFITSHADLVSAGEDWEELEYNVDDTDTAQLFLRGKGLSDTDSIYVNLYKFLEGADSYNWGLRGATGFFPSTLHGAQPGASPESTFMLLHNTTITYWFFANGRRFIIVAKVAGTVYASCYGGFILPYDLPTEYPYPLLISANSNIATQRFSWTISSEYSSMDRGGVTSGDNNAQLINNAADWKSLSTYVSATTQNFLTAINTNYEAMVYPWVGSTFGNVMVDMLPAPGGEVVAIPIILVSSLSLTQPRAVFGQYDGVVAVTGVGNAAEDTITIGADTYIVFQNIFRTAARDYFAIKQA